MVLYRPAKAVTIGHAFRLAEALGATVVIVGRRIDEADEDVLTQTFKRWRQVSCRMFSSAASALRWLRGQRLHIVAAEIASDATPYYRLPLKPGEPVAIVVGSEESGLAKGMLGAAAHRVYVPMVGRSSCLSVGMTLAVVAYHFAYIACGEEPRPGRRSVVAAA